VAELTSAGALSDLNRKALSRHFRSHFLRKAGVHLSGKCSSQPIALMLPRLRQAEWRLDVMNAEPPRLFDFSPFGADLDSNVELVRAFAAHRAFRSAAVEELELDEDFHRRPLRPEDLSFIRFDTPVESATVARLPFLAAQRLLLCVNELQVARLPRDRNGLADCAHFYGDKSQVLAARIRPFLENFSFDFISDTMRAAENPMDLRALLDDIWSSEAGFWRRAIDRLVDAKYLEEGVRFSLIQKWCLAPSWRLALRKASVLGYFDAAVAAGSLPSIDNSEDDDFVRRLAVRCGVAKREHSYWQFYLSTSLAECNLLHALAARPDRAFALHGAAFAAAARWQAFCEAIEPAARLLDVAGRKDGGGRGGAARDQLLTAFDRVASALGERYGRDVVHAVGQGLGAVHALAASVRQNLGEQLRWLASVETYRGIAQAIAARIAAERPDIDRETFVEPREMCSTTHVHDDHRLVVIESGDMVFWGNLGMTLRLKPGEMVLVPEGRLHGSSIESAECTYHQPIIPDEWVAPLVRQLDEGPEMRMAG
jgi:mannose-6-phosphate isomerase-like protein (cupin superfamily)